MTDEELLMAKLSGTFKMTLSNYQSIIDTLEEHDYIKDLRKGRLTDTYYLPIPVKATKTFTITAYGDIMSFKPNDAFDFAVIIQWMIEGFNNERR